MNENKSSRREWVKTAAIIFLSVLLVLTFFSNTIMNYSLPEVAAQYVQSGTITAKIRGTGIIESGDPYEIAVQESRKIQSVAVREGDIVAKGDVILYLEDSESEELIAARDALEAAQDAYDLALLSADVNNNIIQGANGNTSTAGYRQQITAAQNAVEDEQTKVDEWQEKYDEMATRIATLPTNTADVTNETRAFNAAKTVKENAEFVLVAAENELTRISALLENAEEERDNLTVSPGDALLNNIAQLTEQKKNAERNVLNAQTAVNNATLEYDMARTALENKRAQGDTSGALGSLQIQLNAIDSELKTAQKALTEKQEALAELTSNINKTLNLQNLYDAVIEAQEEVDKQMAKSLNATVTADIAGTVTAINVTAGQTTIPGTPVAVLQPEGQGYTMSFSVTNEQAKRLSVGDVAELVNSWRYDEVEVVLKSIKPDKSDPGQKKMLTFEVKGDVIAGQTLNVSVGQKSAEYDLIVPNSAIREDNNGKFILIVESKSSPLGNRFYATRVDVQVLASDDTKSAVSGALYGYEFVITTSTQPVEAGQLVRMAEN
uniref:HlyD family efflux transporter periplasmic adaptor subunit n=1 Tax=Acetatifactor sp. TaxID=1872090 RepID=UPI0040569542